MEGGGEGEREEDSFHRAHLGLKVERLQCIQVFERGGDIQRAEEQLDEVAWQE